MSLEDIQSACVIYYPYLWVREAALGETEGRKNRPVAVGVRLDRGGNDTLLLLPITSRPPGAERHAIEIPPTEKRRAGLDEHLRLWIVLDEYNEDVIGRSYYLTPKPPLGRFGKSYFLHVMKLFIARVSDARRVARHD